MQILADKYGHVVHLGERDCSIQRSNQKVIEECPSPALNNQQRREIGEIVRKAIEKSAIPTPVRWSSYMKTDVSISWK